VPIKKQRKTKLIRKNKKASANLVKIEEDVEPF
jgi:hypothetical protein